MLKGITINISDFRVLAAEFIETKHKPLSEVTALGFYKWVVYERVEVGAEQGKKRRKPQMADFCKQCSMDMFGMDLGDLRDITTQDAFDKGLACLVVCEGCGFIQVDPNGACISKDCYKKHGLLKGEGGESNESCLSEG